MKRVSVGKLTNLKMVAGGEKQIKCVILNGTVRRWVGIGWVDEGPPTERQRKTFPTVVSERKQHGTKT